MFRTLQQHIARMLVILIGLLFAVMIVCQMPSSVMIHTDCIDTGVSISAMTHSGHSTCLFFHEETIEQFGSVMVVHPLNILLFGTAFFIIFSSFTEEIAILRHATRILLNSRIRQGHILWRSSRKKLYRWFSTSFYVYDGAIV